MTRKRVLVTGGAGFVAHHFIGVILDRTNWEVISLDRLDFSGTLDRLHEVMKHRPASQRARLHIVHHDLKAEIGAWVANRIGPIDAIYHIAAGSHVDRSILNPIEFVLDNVLGTANLLEFARKQPSLAWFLYFSTDEVFGPAAPGIKHTEYDAYNSGNPYSATKAGGEELCVAYRNTYKLPVLITHTMNVFGERQHPEKFIPATIAKIRDGQVVKIHSDPTRQISGSRHYIHLDDVADALLFLSARDLPLPLDGRCPKFNIVGEREVSNLELAQMIADIQQRELLYEMVDFHHSRPGHDLRYALDGSLMKRLGWEPQQPLQRRVAEVVQWSLDHPEWLAGAGTGILDAQEALR